MEGSLSLMQGTRAGTDCSPVQAEMTFPTDSESLLRPRQCPQGSFASGEPEARAPFLGDDRQGSLGRGWLH